MPFITQGETNWKFLLIVVILATIAGGGILVYQYWWLHKYEIKPPEITIKNETAGWQTYENKDLSFSFKYPNNWEKIQLIKENNIIEDYPGTLYYWNDQNADFSLVTYSKDYEPYEFNILNRKKVDVNWSASEFASNMDIFGGGNVLFVKKLSERSILVGIYEEPECSPGMSLEVITPLNDAYPNFEIGIGLGNTIEDDPDIKAEIDKEIAETGVACDQLDGYKKVADRIFKGTYSDELNKNIEIARLIADSLTLNQLQATEDWQTYRNEEYGFEFKYPPNWTISSTSEGSFFALSAAIDNKNYLLELSNISPATLNLMGITYCGANPGDSSRCEYYKVDYTTANIDWGVQSENGKNQASAWIGYPGRYSGILTFNLRPVTENIKPLFRQILSNFRFLK